MEILFVGVAIFALGLVVGGAIVYKRYASLRKEVRHIRSQVTDVVRPK